MTNKSTGIINKPIDIFWPERIEHSLKDYI